MPTGHQQKPSSAARRRLAGEPPVRSDDQNQPDEISWHLAALETARGEGPVDSVASTAVHQPASAAEYSVQTGRKKSGKPPRAGHWAACIHASCYPATEYLFIKSFSGTLIIRSSGCVRQSAPVRASPSFRRSWKSLKWEEANWQGFVSKLRQIRRSPKNGCLADFATRTGENAVHRHH